MEVISLLVAVYLAEMLLARLHCVGSFLPQYIDVLGSIDFLWLYGAQDTVVEFEVLSSLIGKRSHYYIFGITRYQGVENIELLKRVLLSVGAVPEA